MTIRRRLALITIIIFSQIVSAQVVNSDSEDLIRATQNGHSGKVKKLLEAGVSPNVKDSSGRSPLHLAAAGGYKQMVCRLGQSRPAGESHLFTHHQKCGTATLGCDNSSEATENHK